MKTIRLDSIANETAMVMRNAVASAVQLGNFPLNICDVQSAFDCWVQDYARSPLGRIHPDYVEGMEKQVRAHLALLGFNL